MLSRLSTVASVGLFQLAWTQQALNDDYLSLADKLKSLSEDAEAKVADFSEEINAVGSIFESMLSPKNDEDVSESSSSTEDLAEAVAALINEATQTLEEMRSVDTEDLFKEFSSFTEDIFTEASTKLSESAAQKFEVPASLTKSSRKLQTSQTSLSWDAFVVDVNRQIADLENQRVEIENFSAEKLAALDPADDLDAQISTRINSSRDRAVADINRRIDELRASISVADPYWTLAELHPLWIDYLRIKNQVFEDIDWTSFTNLDEKMRRWKLITGQEFRTSYDVALDLILDLNGTFRPRRLQNLEDYPMGLEDMTELLGYENALVEFNFGAIDFDRFNSLSQTLSNWRQEVGDESGASNIDVLVELINQWESEATGAAAAEAEAIAEADNFQSIVEVPEVEEIPSEFPLTLAEFQEFRDYQVALGNNDFASIDFARLTEFNTIFAEWGSTEAAQEYQGETLDVLNTIIAELESIEEEPVEPEPVEPEPVEPEPVEPEPVEPEPVEPEPVEPEPVEPEPVEPEPVEPESEEPAEKLPYMDYFDLPFTLEEFEELLVLQEALENLDFETLNVDAFNKLNEQEQVLSVWLDTETGAGAPYRDYDVKEATPVIIDDIYAYLAELEPEPVVEPEPVEPEPVEPEPVEPEPVEPPVNQDPWGRNEYDQGCPQYDLPMTLTEMKELYNYNIQVQERNFGAADYARFFNLTDIFNAWRETPAGLQFTARDLDVLEELIRLIEIRYDFEEPLARFIQLRSRALDGQTLQSFEVDDLSRLYRLVRAYQWNNTLDTYTDDDLIDFFNERVAAQVNPGDFCIYDEPAQHTDPVQNEPYRLNVGELFRLLDLTNQRDATLLRTVPQEIDLLKYTHLFSDWTEFHGLNGKVQDLLRAELHLISEAAASPYREYQLFNETVLRDGSLVQAEDLVRVTPSKEVTQTQNVTSNGTSIYSGVHNYYPYDDEGFVSVEVDSNGISSLLRCQIKFTSDTFEGCSDSLFDTTNFYTFDVTAESVRLSIEVDFGEILTTLIDNDVTTLTRTDQLSDDSVLESVLDMHRFKELYHEETEYNLAYDIEIPVDRFSTDYYLAEHSKFVNASAIHQVIEITDYDRFQVEISQTIHQNETHAFHQVHFGYGLSSPLMEIALKPNMLYGKHTYDVGGIIATYEMFDDEPGSLHITMDQKDTGICGKQVVNFRTNVISRSLKLDGCDSETVSSAEWQFEQGTGDIFADLRRIDDYVELDEFQVSAIEADFLDWLASKETQSSVFTCDMTVGIEQIGNSTAWGFWANQDCSEYTLYLTVVMDTETRGNLLSVEGPELSDKGCVDEERLGGVTACEFKIESGSSNLGLLFENEFRPLFYTADWELESAWLPASDWW